MPRSYLPTIHGHSVRHAEVNRAMNAANVWTDDMVADLKAACLTTASYGTIANDISAKYPKFPKSRNAVIGKAKREGLCAGKPQTASAASAVRKRSVAPGRQAKRSTPSLAQVPVVFKSTEPAALRSEDDRGITNRLLKGRPTKEDIAKRRLGNVPSILEEAPLTSRPVTECERGSCQWPTSDSVQCMEVCGAPAKIGAYCERHATAAYRVMPTNKRNRTFGKDDVDYRTVKLTGRKIDIGDDDQAWIDANAVDDYA